MQKYITSTLIILFVACGIYAIADGLFGSKPKEKPTSSVNYVSHLTEVKQEPKENLQAVKELPYDYKVINSKAVFLPTWNNIFNTVTMPQNLFEELMATYNYKYDTETNNNSWNKYIGDAFFRVNREKEGSLLIQWGNIELNTEPLRQQLQAELTQVQKTDFMESYEYKTENGIIRISIIYNHKENFSFVAFDVFENSLIDQ